MKKKTLITALMIAAFTTGGLSCGTVLAAADPTGSGTETEGQVRHPFKHRVDYVEKWGKALNLTDAQQTQIKALEQTTQQSSEPLLRQLADNREKLDQAMQPGSFNEAGLRELLAKQAGTRTELIVSQAKLHNQIFALLTPEQKEMQQKLFLSMEHRQGHKPHETR